MKKAKFRFAAALLVLTMTLSACGGTSANSVPSNEPPPQPGSSDTSAAQPQDGTAEPITIWVHASSHENAFKAYAETTGNPVNVVNIPYADFQTKLKQSIGDAKTSPDLFVMSRDFAREWVEATGFITNLSQTFPDDLNEYKKNTYESLVVIGSNDGDIYGVTAEYSPGMMFYNREIAEKILGTGDEDEVAAAINSEEKILALNEKLKAEYGGDVKMFGTFYNIAQYYFCSRVEPWVKDGVMEITPEIDHFMDWAKTVYDNDMILAIEEDNAYFNGIGQGLFFLDPLPAWGFNSKIKPQVVDSGRDMWSCTLPYMSYVRGGSFFFIPEASTKKDAAWDAIKYRVLNEDNLYELRARELSFSSNKLVNERLLANGHREPLLGGQEIFKTYNKEVPNVEAKFGNTINITKYDGFIAEFLRDMANSYGAGQITKEAGYKDFKMRMESAYPEITVILPQ